MGCAFRFRSRSVRSEEKKASNPRETIAVRESRDGRIQCNRFGSKSCRFLLESNSFSPRLVMAREFIFSSDEIAPPSEGGDLRGSDRSVVARPDAADESARTKRGERSPRAFCGNPDELEGSVSCYRFPWPRIGGAKRPGPFRCSFPYILLVLRLIFSIPVSLSLSRSRHFQRFIGICQLINEISKHFVLLLSRRTFLAFSGAPIMVRDFPSRAIDICIALRLFVEALPLLLAVQLSVS